MRKPKGVDGLIEVQNPNRVQKVAKKVTELNVNSQVNLSRKERYCTDWTLSLILNVVCCVGRVEIQIEI